MERVPETIEKATLEIFSKVNAVKTNGHFVYTSGKHGSVYVNKDAIYPHTEETKSLCEFMGGEFLKDEVEVVIAPAVGGTVLSQGVAYFLTRSIKRDILGIYAEHEEELILKAKDHTEGFQITVPTTLTLAPFYFLHQGDKLIIKKITFVIGRDYKRFVPGKNILIVEDVVNTGGSVKGVIEAVRKLGGRIVGVGALCNRGGITEKDLDVPKFIPLTNISLEAWEEKDCPLCAQGIPINENVGKGK